MMLLMFGTLAGLSGYRMPAVWACGMNESSTKTSAGAGWFAFSAATIRANSGASSLESALVNFSVMFGLAASNSGISFFVHNCWILVSLSFTSVSVTCWLLEPAVEADVDELLEQPATVTASAVVAAA